MNVHPIRNERDYEQVLEDIEELWGSPIGSENGDLLDILIALVENYESKHYPVFPPDPIEAIKFRMEQMSLSRKDLEPYIGSRGRVAEIFSRKRPLTLPMIRKLHSQLQIPLESLIHEQRSVHG